MYICKFCGKEFEKQQSYAAHLRKHNNLSDNDKKTNEYTFICQKCGKKYTLTLRNIDFKQGNYKKYCCKSCANTRILSEETKQKISNSIHAYNINNPYTNYKIYTCKVCGKTFNKFDNRNISGQIYCSKECKHKFLSEHTGGYRKGCGRGKSGWYKGIYCDSSWELAFVIYHLDNNLYIERCKEKRKYIYNNTEHIYIPDFITNEGIIEIKGYKTKQWEIKENSNPDIKVLYKNDIKFYLDYVKQKYGNDYIKLYDNSNPYLVKDIYSQKYIWMFNPTLKINTMINPNKFNEYINNGWLKGRMKFK